MAQALWYLPDAREASCQLFINEMNVTIAFHHATGQFLDPDEQLAIITDRLQALDANCNDARCCVKLNRSGTIGDVGTAVDGLEDITTQSELDAVFAFSNYNVKIVSSMNNVCGGTGAIDGCTILGSRSGPGGNQNTIVTNSAQGPVWAHEFGHAQGLQHYSSTCTQLIMRYPTSTAANAVTVNECTTFRQFPSHIGAICSGTFPDPTYSYFIPEAGSYASPTVWPQALQYFRGCPNNDLDALPNNARVRVVLRDVQDIPIAGISASEIYMQFNGGTAIQGFFGPGADSIIANTRVNYSPPCVDVRFVTADAATDANGVAYITFKGPGGVRDPFRKWGHWDSAIPVVAANVNLSGRRTPGDQIGSYALQIKNRDAVLGLGNTPNVGEVVTGVDVNQAVAELTAPSWMHWWLDLNWDGFVSGLDVNMIVGHLNHDCDTPNPF